MFTRTIAACAVACLCASGVHAQSTLRTGSSGAEVVQVQKQLRQHGYPVATSGRYDATTARAVKAFQRSRSLPATGRVDAQTASSLARPLSRGDSSPFVERLQAFLNGQGQSVEATGTFDESTENALRALQRLLGYDPTGEVDAESFEQLDGATQVQDPLARLQRLIGEAEAHLRANPRGFRSDVLAVIDYGVHSSNKRLFVYDRNTKHVRGYRVGHGMESDPQDTGYVQSTSTRSPAGTWVGVFRTAETFTWGRLGKALRLDGLSDTNIQARSQHVVIHRSPRRSRIGAPVARSLSGPTLEASEVEEVIERIKGGALLYVPDPQDQLQPHGDTPASERIEAAERREDELDVSPRGGRVNYRGFTVSSGEVRAVLQRIADRTGRTVRVTSGDRDFVPTGGSRTSLHLHHRAADFTIMGLGLSEAFGVLRQHRQELFRDGGYEVIYHQPGTNTGGPHLHVGFRGAGRPTTFKTEVGGRYTVVN